MNKDIKEVQKLAKELGHCLCSPVLKCPCPAWVKKKICRCATHKDEK